MPHIRIQRLCPGYAQHNRPKGQKGEFAVVKHELQRIGGGEGEQNMRVVHDLDNAERTQRTKPEQHDRAKYGAHPARTHPLHAKQADNDQYGNRDNHLVRCGNTDFHPFDG